MMPFTGYRYGDMQEQAAQTRYGLMDGVLTVNYKDVLNRLSGEGIAMEIDEETRTRLQRTLMEMYSDLLKVCEKHGLTPYLGGGTALGALRHGGFIPWDDDMDVNMTRADYLRFQEVFEAEMADRYILNAPNYSETSIARFPKLLKKGTRLVEIGGTNEVDLQCVALDIFIIENVPDNRLVRWMKGMYCNALAFIASRVGMHQNESAAARRLYRAAGWKSYCINKLIGILFSYRKASAWNDRVDHAVRYGKEGKLCGIPTGRKHYFGEIYPRGDLFPAAYAGFETLKAPVFAHCDRYLTSLYGDYMQIPPEDKRERHLVERLEL